MSRAADGEGSWVAATSSQPEAQTGPEMLEITPEEKEARKLKKKLERKAKAKKVLNKIKYKAALFTLGKF